MAEVMVLDASVLIAHLDTTDANHQAAEELLLEGADEGFAASALTVAEVLVGPARVGRLEEAARVLRELGVEIVPVAGDAAARLARLRADSGLRLPDCCVLLATMDTGDALATFDERQAQAARRSSVPVLGGSAG